jgi:glycosyltransferase involved in cell wall biosynthesis
MPGPDRRPRVLVATSHFPLYRRGDVTGNFVVDPILGLVDAIDYRVVTPADETDAPTRAMLEGKVDVRRFRYWWPRPAQRVAYRRGIPTNLRDSWLARAQLPGFIVRFVVSLVRHAFRWADVVHAHWLPVALLALPARWLTGARILVTLHGTDITQFPRWFTRFGLARVDAIVTAHEDLFRDARELAPSVPTHQIRHLVEPQPVDPAAIAEVRERLGDGPVVLFVARLSPERDPVALVRAAARVVAEVPDARFAVVGQGALEDDLHRTIAELGLEDHVVLFGYRDDVWTFLRTATCFVALSDRNNIWVTAMVEAMRAGLPVVATTAGDTADELTDGVDALLVPVGDEAAIAAALVRLLSDPGLRDRLAQGAADRLTAAGFDPERVKAETVALYAELAGGR